MDTIGLPDPDSPDQADHTMRNLELVSAMDEHFPQWRGMVGECQREGVPLGWVTAGSGPAGTLFADIDVDGHAPDARPLVWDARQRYLLLRTPQAPEFWLRALPHCPARFHVDAVLQAHETEQEHGVRCWQALTAAGEPVLLADDLAGGHGRPWLLRSDASYGVEYDDVEGGWRVYGHNTPEGTIALPEP